MYVYDFKQVPTPDANTDREPGAFPTASSTAANLLANRAWLLLIMHNRMSVLLKNVFVFNILCKYMGRLDSDSHPWIC